MENIFAKMRFKNSIHVWECSLKTIFIFLMCCSLPSSRANCQKIDSLKSLLPFKTGKEKCDMLYQIAYEYIDVNNSEALKFSDQAMKMANMLGDTLQIVKTSRLKAMALRRVGDMDSSIVVSLSMLPIIQRHGYLNELTQQNTAIKPRRHTSAVIPQSFIGGFSILLVA